MWNKIGVKIFRCVKWPTNSETAKSLEMACRNFSSYKADKSIGAGSWIKIQNRGSRVKNEARSTEGTFRRTRDTLLLPSFFSREKISPRDRSMGRADKVGSLFLAMSSSMLLSLCGRTTAISSQISRKVVRSIIFCSIRKRVGGFLSGIARTKIHHV